jgi:flagellar basal-body rod protein FlgG
VALELQTTADAFNRKCLLLDQVSSNLANAGTAGFKAERMFFQVSEGGADGEAVSFYTYAPCVKTDFTEGMPLKTGNPLDLVIDGEGFFTVETPDGEAYTKKGNFTINGKGELVTGSGNPVVGESGRLVIEGQEVSVGPDGTITVDGTVAGKLKISGFRNVDALERTQDCCFRDGGNAEPYRPDDVTVQSGFLEQSNVNVVQHMIEMIDIHRSLESYQKIIQTLSDQDKMSTNRIGRLA